MSAKNTPHRPFGDPQAVVTEHRHSDSLWTPSLFPEFQDQALLFRADSLLPQYPGSGGPITKAIHTGLQKPHMPPIERGPRDPEAPGPA